MVTGVSRGVETLGVQQVLKTPERAASASQKLRDTVGHGKVPAVKLLRNEVAASGEIKAFDTPHEDGKAKDTTPKDKESDKQPQRGGLSEAILGRLDVCKRIDHAADPSFEYHNFIPVQGISVTSPVTHQPLQIALNDKKDEIISGSIRAGGSWEADKLTLVFKALMQYPDASLLDIGTNLGVFTLMAAAEPLNRRVIGVEMQQREYSRLCASIRKNGLDDRIRLAGVAVGDHVGSVPIGSPDDNGDHNPGATGIVSDKGQMLKHIPSHANLGEVNMDTWDRIFPELIKDFHGIGKDFVMKIDVEGAELLFFEGAKNFFREHKPKFVLMETEFFSKADMQRVLDVTGLTPVTVKGKKLEGSLDSWFHKKEGENNVTLREKSDGSDSSSLLDGDKKSNARYNVDTDHDDYPVEDAILLVEQGSAFIQT